MAKATAPAAMAATSMPNENMAAPAVETALADGAIVAVVVAGAEVINDDDLVVEGRMAVDIVLLL